MNHKILVNKVEIEKDIIRQFLIQNKKVEAVRYICDIANIGLASSKSIVDLFQDGEIDAYDGKDLNPEQKNTYQTSKIIIEPKSRNKTKIRLAVLAFVVLGAFLFLKNVVGFVHIPYHLSHLKQNILSFSFNNDDDVPVEDIVQDLDSNTIVEVAVDNPVKNPIDLRMWEHQIKNGDELPDGVKEEIESYKNRDFSKLIKASDFPTDKEAQQAIVQNYKADVVKLLQEYDAHIKIGVAYDAPLKPTQDNDPEIARVTAMVSAFNAKRGNMGNIQRPLDVIYDFVKYESDPFTWYLADFSQSIPYDLKLNKDPW
ncbi:hypothetical protein HNQ02_003304 [Flavobacterium sp. 7E]|uniref:hypothetical protein n=1 Tax=Flavobacterium sp. 7E TaxID=2735898 RepID=UPI001C2DAE35|nr:hypothetical protein [Flavobacterium sp. 7E]NRS90364.1 hypothetical protein [Flavobacterium sp. 7E]